MIRRTLLPFRPTFPAFPTFRTLGTVRALGAAGLVLSAGLWSAAQAQAPTPAPTAGGHTAAACTDFYAHANGDWLARTELPADRARIGSFDQLAIRNTQVVLRSLERLVQDPAQQTTPGLKLLATWYGSALDPAIAEAAGLRSAQALLEAVATLRDRSALPELLARFTSHRLGGPVGVFVGPDNQDVRRNLLAVSAGGLGLPERDDYRKSDPTSQRLREAYRTYASRLLELAQLPHDAARIDALMDFEGRIADALLSPVERRDPQATNNRRTLKTLQAEAPGLDWTQWLRASGVSAQALGEEQAFLLAQPRHAQAVAQLAQSAPLAVWQTYLQVRLLDTLAPWMGTAYQTAHFDYKQRAQRGLSRATPRAEQLVDLIGGRTGFEPLAQTLGELFVQNAFSPTAQAKANQMIEDVREAMRIRIDGLPWMSSATKARAQAKLAAMTAQIGGPSRWPDYSGLSLDPRDPAGNALKVNAWAHAKRLADLGKPTDRNEWSTSPHIVNAFAAGLNRIVFPAGILQPPFFDEKAEDAANYGGIGMVIGHEIIHHFDDRGRQYDAVGNLADWWEPQDAAAYKARADRAADFYSQYEPLPGLRINGRQMLGENISDLGGIQIAFDALQIALKRQPAPAVAGSTPEQRFFFSNALIWRGKQRNEALEQQIRTGQHSPGPFRVRGPLTNMPAFAQAFGCKKGDPMVSDDPVVVW